MDAAAKENKGMDSVCVDEDGCPIEPEVMVTCPMCKVTTSEKEIVENLVKTFTEKLNKNPRADVSSEYNDIVGIELEAGSCQYSTLNTYVDVLDIIITTITKEVKTVQDQIEGKWNQSQLAAMLWQPESGSQPDIFPDTAPPPTLAADDR